MGNCQLIRILKDEDWDAFHALASDVRQTTDDLWGWLLSRGYVISRSAVWRYVAACRDRAMFPARSTLGCRSDSALRRKLTAWIQTLQGAELAMVGVMAAFLVDAGERAKCPDRKRRLSAKRG